LPARQVPVANPSLVREAIRRIDPLWDSPAFRALRDAEPGSVRYDFTFTMPYQRAGSAAPATVFHGTCDVLFRDRQGQGNLILIADARVCHARQRLRLQVSALAARTKGFGPVRQGWLVRHGVEAESDHEFETNFSDDAISLALATSMVDLDWAR
jgi:hypothetical protein